MCGDYHSRRMTPIIAISAGISEHFADRLAVSTVRENLPGANMALMAVPTIATVRLSSLIIRLLEFGHADLNVVRERAVSMVVPAMLKM